MKHRWLRTSGNEDARDRCDREGCAVLRRFTTREAKVVRPGIFSGLYVTDEEYSTDGGKSWTTVRELPGGRVPKCGGAA